MYIRMTVVTLSS